MMLPGLPRSAVGQKNKNWIYFLDFLEWEWWNTREILNVGNSRWLVIFKERTIKELSTVFQNTCTDTTQFTNNKNRQLNEHFKIHSENHWLVFVCVFFSYYGVDREQSLGLCTDPLLPSGKLDFSVFSWGEGGVCTQAISLSFFISVSRAFRSTDKEKKDYSLSN